MALELSLSVVIHRNMSEIDHALQLKLFEEACKQALVKFAEHRELPLDGSLDFDFTSNEGNIVDVWLARPK